MHAFLEERLPVLGLDVETYGSYLIGLVDEGDGEEWDDILELLQASSETHSDDEAAWVELKTEIQRLQREQDEVVRQKELDARQTKLQEGQERLAQEIALSKQAEEEAADKAEHKKELDDAKRAVVERYAYDESEVYGNDGQLLSGGGSEKIVNNKEAAAQAHLDTVKQEKNKNVASKKDEQKKTADAKKDKQRVKEERRNRTTKGERRR